MGWLILGILALATFIWRLGNPLEHPQFDPDLAEQADHLADIRRRIDRIRLASRLGTARSTLRDVYRRNPGRRERQEAQQAFVARAWEEVEVRRDQRNVYQAIEILEEIQRVGDRDDAARASSLAAELRRTEWT